MTISYPITMPQSSTLSTKTFSMTLWTAQSMTRSPFTLEPQIFDYDAERWTLSVSYPPLAADNAKLLQAFLASLKGFAGTFLAYDPLAKAPRGIGGGAPVVSGGGQTGYTLVVRGGPISTTGWLKAGDRISIANRLYIILQDVNTNGAGATTLDIQPSIRGTLSDGQAITLTDAKGIFRLEDSRPGWSADDGRTTDISFSAVEA